MAIFPPTIFPNRKRVPTLLSCSSYATWSFDRCGQLLQLEKTQQCTCPSLPFRLKLSPKGKEAVYNCRATEDGRTLRMRSRLTACQYITEDTRKPVILPTNHPVTTLIITYYHKKFTHQNHEAIINELRQKYVTIEPLFTRVIKRHKTPSIIGRQRGAVEAELENVACFGSSILETMTVRLSTGDN